MPGGQVLELTLAALPSERPAPETTSQPLYSRNSGSPCAHVAKKHVYH